MKRKSKTLLAILSTGALLMNAGCSGINASHSISPASFFLPGLLKAEPPPAPASPIPPTVPTVQAAKQVALAR